MNEWINLIMNCLAVIGACVVALCIGLLLSMLLGKFRNWYQDWKHRQKIAHQFDKKPKAECYCVDCVHWCRDEEARQSGYCAYNGQHVLECFFCKCAEIRRSE